MPYDEARERRLAAKYGADLQPGETARQAVRRTLAARRAARGPTPNPWREFKAAYRAARDRGRTTD